MGDDKSVTDLNPRAEPATMSSRVQEQQTIENKSQKKILGIDLESLDHRMT